MHCKHQAVDYYGNGILYNYGAGLYSSAAGTNSTCLAIGYMPNGIDGSWDNAEFRVTGLGELYATNAHITGEITATSGSFTGTLNVNNGYVGGLSINPQGLCFRNGNTGVGLWGTTAHANIALHAGANSSNIGGAPFRVYHDGSLVATNANITGTINASLGNFGIFKIGKNISQSGLASNGLCGEVGSTGNKRFLSFDPGYIAAIAEVGEDLYKPWTAILGAATGSDRNLKTDISNINSICLEIFYDKLKPCSFKYKANTGQGSSMITHYGVIAQDVIEAEKELGIRDSAIVLSEENEPLMVRYNEFIALNIWQIQKLKSEIALLKTQLSNIEQSLSV